MKVAFLVSGALGESVLKYFINKLNVEFVLTDNNSNGIIELCKKFDTPFFAGNPRSSKIDNFISNLECDVIASVNYLFLIDKKIIQIAKGLCFNIHGSLLPKYRGRTPHVWAIINGEKQTGVTAHIIDEGCDTGAIIKQVQVNIDKDDTGADILNKYRDLYIPLIDFVLKSFIEDKIELEFQNESKATYFGKRTPDDGRINWDWSVDRIINWIRAQAHPYPGAFSYHNNNKIIIDKASPSDFGFNFQVPNGTILSDNPLVIKCATGALQIDTIRNKNHNFRINDLLY